MERTHILLKLSTNIINVNCVAKNEEGKKIHFEQFESQTGDWICILMSDNRLRFRITIVLQSHTSRQI